MKWSWLSQDDANNQLYRIIIVQLIQTSLVSKVAFLASAFFASPTLADTVPLNEYLETMDRSEVSFTGRIKYDRGEDSFTFYDENREWFGVTLDAGRDTRELIETECENSSFMVSYSDLCTISGSGTVEIRGSRIFISIETVDQLSK